MKSTMFALIFSITCTLAAETWSIDHPPAAGSVRGLDPGEFDAFAARIDVC